MGSNWPFYDKSHWSQIWDVWNQLLEKRKAGRLDNLLVATQLLWLYCNSFVYRLQFFFFIFVRACLIKLCAVDGLYRREQIRIKLFLRLLFFVSILNISPFFLGEAIYCLTIHQKTEHSCCIHISAILQIFFLFGFINTLILMLLYIWYNFRSFWFLTLSLTFIEKLWK